MQEILFLLFVLGVCYTCKTPNNQIDGEENINYTGPTLSSMTDIIESIHILPLEYKDSVIWGNKPIVLHKDSSFYIVDKYGTRQIFRYSENGKFMNIIGKVGRGPEEYLSLEDVYIEEHEDNLYLLSSPYLSLYCYSKNGKFRWKKTKKITVSSFTCSPEGYWLYLGYNNPYGKERLLLADTAFNIKKSFLPLDTKIFPILGDPNFNHNNTSIFFREELSPRIYEIQGDSLKLQYLFDFGNYNIPQSYFKTKNPMESFNKMTHNGFIDISNFWDCDAYAMVEATMQSNTHSAIIYGIKNKKNNTWSWVEYESTISDLFFFKIKGFSKSSNHLIVLVNGGDLMNMKEEEKKLISNIDEIKFNFNDIDNESFVLLCKLNYDS